MGKLWIPGGGSGAGSGSDECTASKSEVLKGYSAVTSDSDDEPAQGTLELTGDASDGQVLSGKTYYNTDPKKKRTGSMANQGAVSVKLNAGEGYTIPSGFHNGGGKVEANGLASQTPGNATAAHILSGQSAWVNGFRINGTMTVNSILNFNVAAYSTNQVLLQWQNPYAAEGKPFSGVFINYSTNGYPGTSGTRIYTGYGNNITPGGWSQAIVSVPASGTTYYFSATTYTTCSAGDLWGTTFNAKAATFAQGQEVITSSGIFTVPANVYSIDIFCVGGGGSGSGGYRNIGYYAGGGGGGGKTATIRGYSVNPGLQLSVVVGAGGAQVEFASEGNRGGDTYVTNGGTTIAYANGGLGGRSYGYGYGGAGGSAGGRGAYGHRTAGVNAENGGSDGESRDGASGQGTTTKAFGESWNTLYAGGGGGGGNAQNYNTNRGYGGSGGGGNGSDAMGASGSPGTWATGGGGGGGFSYSADNAGFGYAGGSGVCIIRWGY